MDDDTQLSVDNVVELLCPALLARVATCADEVACADSLVKCVRRLTRYARCSKSAFIVALVLLRRAEAAACATTPPDPCLAPGARSQTDVLRLFVVALLLAAKTTDDRCYSNAHYARISGALSKADLVTLERRTLELLRYRVFVHPEEYAAVSERLLVSIAKPAPAPIPAPFARPVPLLSTRCAPLPAATAAPLPKRARVVADATRSPCGVRATCPTLDADLDGECTDQKLNVNIGGSGVASSAGVSRDEKALDNRFTGVQHTGGGHHALTSMQTANVAAWVSVLH